MTPDRIPIAASVVKLLQKEQAIIQVLMNLDSAGRCTGCGNQVYKYFILPSRADR